MKFFKSFFLALTIIFVFVYCTKNGVVGNISPTSIQLINTYYGKTFSLQTGGNTVVSNTPYDSASLFASGPPGFYSLLVTDATSNANILAGNINLQSGEQYSLFLIRDSAQNSDSVRYSLVTNNAIRPQFDSVKIRILNFARNLPYTNLYFYINRGPGVIGALSPFVSSIYTLGRRYLDNNQNPAVAQYFTIPAGPRYNIKFLNGSDTSIRVMDSILFQPDTATKLYTLCLEGRYDADSVGKYKSPDSLKLKFIRQ
ncbi:MAG TPA: DUF4397 domain-containing protein [Arachidicoccus sp.]